MRGIQVKEYVSVRSSIPSTTHHRPTGLTTTGTTRPQSHRPRRSQARSRPVPNPSPRRRNQFLRPPANPRKVPIPAAPPLGLRRRIRRHSPANALQRPRLGLQERRPRLRRVAGRICHAGVRDRPAAAAHAGGVEFLRVGGAVRDGADELCGARDESRRQGG